MALHGGLDTVAITTLGVYSETYTSADIANLPSLFTTYGYLEDAPTPVTSRVRLITVKIPSSKFVLQADSRKKRKIFM